MENETCECGMNHISLRDSTLLKLPMDSKVVIGLK